MEKSQLNEIVCFHDEYPNKVQQQNQGFDMDDDLIFIDEQLDVPQIKIGKLDERENQKLHSRENSPMKQKYPQFKNFILDDDKQSFINNIKNNKLTKEMLDKLPRAKQRHNALIISKKSNINNNKKQIAFKEEDDHQNKSTKRKINYEQNNENQTLNISQNVSPYSQYRKFDISKKLNASRSSKNQSIQNLQHNQQFQQQQGSPQFQQKKKSLGQLMNYLYLQNQNDSDIYPKRQSRTFQNLDIINEELSNNPKYTEILGKLLKKMGIKAKKSLQQSESSEITKSIQQNTAASTRRMSRSTISQFFKNKQDINQILSSNDQKTSFLSQGNYLGFSRQPQFNNQNNMNMSKSRAVGMDRYCGTLNKQINIMSQSRKNPMMMSKYGLLNKNNQMLASRIPKKFTPNSIETQQNKQVDEQNQNLHSIQNQNLNSQDLDQNNLGITIINALAQQGYLNLNNDVYQNQDKALYSYGQNGHETLMVIDEPHKNWEYYFPHNNINKVIKSIKRKQKKIKHKVKDSMKYFNSCDLGKFKRKISHHMQLGNLTSKFKQSLLNNKKGNSNSYNIFEKQQQLEISMSNSDVKKQQSKINSELDNTQQNKSQGSSLLKSPKYMSQIRQIQKFNLNINKNINDNQYENSINSQQQLSNILSPNNRSEFESLNIQNQWSKRTLLE